MIYLLDDTTLIVELEVPASVTAGRHASIELDLVATYPDSDDPQDEHDWLKIQLQNDDGTYQYRIRKSVDGDEADVIDWTEVDNNNVVFKLVFREHKAVYENTAIYIDDGETGTFEEEADSPYELDLAFDKAYPVFCMETDDATERTCYSDYVTVDYPNFKCKYDLATANLGLGDCKVFDTNGSADEADWTRVYDADHTFTGDCVIQNGLARVWVDFDLEYGLKQYFWNGTAWDTTYYCRFSAALRVPNLAIRYPRSVVLKRVTTESITIHVNLKDSSDIGRLTLQLKLMQGSYYVEVSGVSSVWDYPYYGAGPSDFYILFVPNGTQRFGFSFDAETLGIQDTDVSVSVNNTTMTENFGVSFDNDKGPAIYCLAFSEEPDGYAYKYIQNYTGYIGAVDFKTLQLTTFKLYSFIIPFTDIANLLKEAEDATLAGGAGTADLGDDSGESAELDAQNENVSWTFTAGTDLPAGRYIALFRIKDTNQVADDVEVHVKNSSDGEYRNQENDEVTKTVTSDFAYYQVIFDITDQDVSDTDDIELKVNKALADANTIYVDYFLIVPIGDGESWPQDIAHNAMRALERDRRVYRR